MPQLPSDPRTLLSQAVTLFHNADLEGAHRRIQQAKEQTGDNKKFAELLESVGLTEAAPLLEQHLENETWLNDLKKLYRPFVERKIQDYINEQTQHIERTATELIPKLRNKRAQFWAERRLTWRAEAMRNIVAQGKDELMNRVTELANLQVRLSLILTLTTAMLAVVSLWSKSSTWTISLAAITGCGVLGIALIPMKSSFRQAWVNKHVDAVVWAAQAADELGQICILRNGTHGRNKVIRRYKTVLWTLVPCFWLILAGVASLSIMPLFA
jgi:hypothetical protein